MMAKRQVSAGVLACAIAAGLVASCGGGTDQRAPAQAARSCGGDGACVSTVAGSGEFGTGDGQAATAEFFMPHAIAVDEFSQVHVADYGSSNQTRLLADGRVSTLAEDPIDFPNPAEGATDAAGNRYVADTYGHRILRITPGGDTSVFAGTGETGDQDGAAAAASFSLPAGLAFDASGALYVADMGNRKIRKITFAAAGG
jgi:serine/threonine-protein kinase